jgi:hypothetical protein
MKLISLKQYSKMTKARLVRKIIKALKKLPKTKLAKICYELEKRKLPNISKTNQKALPKIITTKKKTKTKRKGRFKKASPEAKRYMAKIRRMRK